MRIKRKVMKQLTLKVKKEVSERANDLCESCHKGGDFRGLHYHHVIHKGMGGAGKRIYTAKSIRLLCARCHMTGDHGIREV